MLVATEKPQILDRSIDLDFFADTINLFLHREEGHMQPYIHLEGQNDQNGTELWRNAVSDPRFPTKRETSLIVSEIPYLLSMLPPNIDKYHVVEIGPGDLEAVENKTIPFLKALGEKAGKYIAIDVHGHYAGAACDIVKSKMGIPTSFVVKDFRTVEAVAHGHPAIGVVWGGTLWNTATTLKTNQDDQLTSQFRNVAKCLGPESHLFFTHYDDGPESIVPYNTPQTKQALKGILRAMKRDLETNLNPNNFYIRTQFNAKLSRVEMQAVANCSHELQINGRYKIAIGVGEAFTLVNALKLTREQVEARSEPAGYETAGYRYDSATHTGLLYQRN